MGIASRAGSTRAEPRTSTLAYRYLATCNEAIEVISGRNWLGSNRRVCAEGTAALFKAIRCCTVEISGERNRRVGLRAEHISLYITVNASGVWGRQSPGPEGSKAPSCGTVTGGVT